VGYTDSGTVTQCCWDTQSSGQGKSAGGTGLTTAQMQDIRTYLDAGWDWVGEMENGTQEVWQMPPGGGYPVVAAFNGYRPPQLKGSGTLDDPYLISSAADLGAVVHYSTRDHYRLTASIDLSGIRWGMAVMPSFAGTFDGNGHTISHLTIRGGDFLGLFGHLNSGAEVKNLGLVDANVTSSGSFIGGLVGENQYGIVTQCHSTGVVRGGGQYVGGLVGENQYGTVTQCYSTGAVSGGSTVGGLVGRNEEGDITASHSSATVTGDSFVGGLVAWNSGSIAGCSSTGTVKGGGEIGGLVGRNEEGSKITASYSSATVSGGDSVGGLLGYNSEGEVDQCYSTGAVSGTQRVGGLVGSNYDSITNCYSTGAVNGEDEVGGLVGFNGEDGGIARSYSIGRVTAGHGGGGLVGWDSEDADAPERCLWDIETSGRTTSRGGTGKTTAEMQTAKTFLDAGWDFVGETANGTEDIWWIDEGKDYPRLWWEAGDEASQF